MPEHPTALPFAALTPDQRAAVEVAAVLETFDDAALAAILDTRTDETLARLGQLDLVQTGDRLYQLPPALQAAALAALDAQRQRLRELHARAERHYAARLAAAGPAEQPPLEAVYMRHLEQVAEALIQQEPTALADTAGAAPIDLLAEPYHRALLRYYRGLGAGLLEDFEQARREFDQLLAEPDLDDVVRARVLNSDATFARLQGDYERARDEYAASYAIWCRLDNPARQGLALLNQGVLNYYLQDYSAAQRDLYASLELFRAVDAVHSQALAYLDLGLVARDQGRWGEAIALSQQAGELFAREGAIDFVGYASNNIGEVEMLRGNLDTALGHFERALAEMSTRAYVVDIYLNMGLVRQAQGDDVAGLERYRAALNLALELGRREIVALIHYRIGHAEQRLGRLEAARAAYDAAIAMIEDTRAPVRDEGLLISLMGRWQQIYEAAFQLCLDRGDGAAAFDYAERARARAFADMLARRGGLVQQNKEQRTENREPKGHGDMYGKPSVAASAGATPITAAEAQAALSPGTLLLAYFATGLRGPESALLDAIPSGAAGLRACLATPARLLLLALTRDGLRVHVCLLDPNMLQASSPYLADGRRFLQPPILRRAYDALIAPAADLLAAAERVVIVPHGPLHQLPFAALLDPAGRPLLETAPDLRYAPSTTLLLRARHQRTIPRRVCLALGYDGAAGRRLRHTEAEAAAVARLCGGEVWRGGVSAPALRAGERAGGRLGMAKRLRDAAGAYRWLHLACHGEFDLDDPLRSWLEIGPGERLSAADVLDDFALGAELVALSACRSGVSRVLRGDEPMGLVRAFLSAGARAVLVTLWPVEDISTRLLMERFYPALLAGNDPAAALREAQRALRDLTLAEARDILAGWGEEVADMPAEDSVRPYADPAFWAAYTLVGAALGPPLSAD
jgi:CHAT domain-containing protein/tetratricopeptide (TPR) repeat protein